MSENNNVKKQILANTTPDETRIAILENDRIADPAEKDRLASLRTRFAELKAAAR